MFRWFSTVAILTWAASATAAEGTFTIVSESSRNGAAVQGLSANGSVVTGVSDGRVFRWTADQGLTYISPRDILHTFYTAVSADGSTIVSTVADATGLFSAARWTEQEAAWQTLGGLPQQTSPDGHEISTSWGVSADGATVVGLGWHTNDRAEAFQWTEGTGMVGLGQPAEGKRSSRASAISADASTVVGFFEHPSFGYRRPVRWVNGGAPDLFLGEDMPGEVLAANSDGSRIVGGASLTGSGNRAFLYSDSTGVRDLGIIGDDPFGLTQSVASAVSDDGSVVGWVGDIFYGSPQGFIWTPDGGMVLVNDYLASQGVTVPDEWYIVSVTVISADGKTLGGQAINLKRIAYAGWIATVP
jgi:probable HAF family extracellular repeat protein